MTIPKTEKHHFGWFQAKYLWPLLPFVERARAVHPLRFLDGIITLEPCPEGGAYIVAVTGHATVIIRDPDARIDAVVTLDIPDAAFRAARETLLPCMNYCGEHYLLPVPEWLQPGRVYVYSAGMHISPKMRHPAFAEEDDEFQPAFFSAAASVGHHVVGTDYRMTEGRPIDWRRLLRLVTDMPPAELSAVHFNPDVPALFSDLLEAVVADNEGRLENPFPEIAHTMVTDKQDVTFLLRFGRHPDILGLWKGMKPAEGLSGPIPAHFFADADSQEQGAN